MPHRIISLLILFSLSFSENTYLDIIYLKNGTIKQGTITVNNPNLDFIQIISNGRTYTYFYEDIALLEPNAIRINTAKHRTPFEVIVGAGIGSHYMNAIVSSSLDEDPFSLSSVSTNLKIGIVANRRVQFHMSRTDNFLNMATSSTSVLMSNSLSSISVVYFMNPKLKKSKYWVPSIFLSAGYGFSLFGPYDDDDFPSWIGEGYFVSVGYEINKNLNLELCMINMTSKPQSGLDDYDSEFSIDGFGLSSTSFQLDVNFILDIS